MPNVEPESIICENDENWLAQCNAPRNRDPESHCAKCCKRIKTTTTTTTNCICIFIDLNRATASKAGRGRGQEKRKEAVKKGLMTGHFHLPSALSRSLSLSLCVCYAWSTASNVSFFCIIIIFYSRAIFILISGPGLSLSNRIWIRNWIRNRNSNTHSSTVVVFLISGNNKGWKFKNLHKFRALA